jgi:DHA1 family bicyclomycin/chloramphenicol resistance-like MFS transporter
VNTANPSAEGSTRQKYLGRKGLIIFLAALSAFPALSTDLYLPALPGMTAYFGVPEYQTNLTLILFFIFYAVAILMWGPLSDRFGRRPVLLVGLACYTVAGALCAVSANVFQLMVFRVLQAVGAGAASSVSTAVVKDAYAGRKRELTLAIIGSMVVLSPMVAPAIGALILQVTSWRGAFMAQAALGVLMFAGTVAFEETLRTKLTGNPLSSLKRLGIVLKHSTFRYLMVNFSLTGVAGMAFITSSSYIYQAQFGVSSQAYSGFFAVFSVGLAVGPQLYMWLSRRVTRTAIITGCFVVCTLSGVLIIFIGPLGPWPMILVMMPASLSFGCVRPPATYILLDQHEGDAGSVSALMGSWHMVLSSAGMVIVSLDIWGRIELVGTMTLVLGLLSLLMWLSLGRPRVRAQMAAKGNPGETSLPPASAEPVPPA